MEFGDGNDRYFTPSLGIGINGSELHIVCQRGVDNLVIEGKYLKSSNTGYYKYFEIKEIKTIFLDMNGMMFDNYGHEGCLLIGNIKEEEEMEESTGATSGGPYESGFGYQSSKWNAHFGLRYFPGD